MIQLLLLEVTIERMIFTQTYDGRPSGECYCQLQNASEVEAALKYDKRELKTRYVEGERRLAKSLG